MTTKFVHLLVLAALFAAPTVFAAADGKGKNKGPQGGGGIEFILEHAQDLALTADQKTKLTDLETKVKKSQDDSEIKDLRRQMYELNESGATQNEIRALRKKIREATEKKLGMSMEDMMMDVRKMLSSTQLVKLADLRKDAGMDATPGKAMKEERQKEKDQEKADSNHTMADNSQPPPKLYDDK